MTTANTIVACARFPGLRFRIMHADEAHRPAEPGRVWAEEVLTDVPDPPRLELRVSELEEVEAVEGLEGVAGMRILYRYSVGRHPQWRRFYAASDVLLPAWWCHVARVYRWHRLDCAP